MVNEINLFSIVKTNRIVDSYLLYDETPGYCYIMVPSSLGQPTIFRNSNEDCGGFLIPFVRLDDVNIIDYNGDNIIYYVYRSFVSTKANVDIWICE